MHMLKSAKAPRFAPMVMAIAAVLALSSTGTAMAQETGAEASTGDPSVDDATPQDTSNDRVTDLGEVVVTADKREENINKVPSAISVIGAVQIEKLNATQLTDYANYVPGLQVRSQGTPGQTTVTLRGIAALSSGSTVGTYLDEVPVGSSGIYQAATLFALDLLPYDIERVEVLRGPQGTLYGAGAMGGLLKYVMRAPDLNETEFRVGGGVSSVANGGTGNNFRLGANIPLSKDSVGLRVSYSRNDIPGFVDNVVNGEQDINEGSQTSARASLLWQGESASLKLSAMRQTIDSDNNATVSLQPGSRAPIGGELTSELWVNEPFTKDIDFYSATLDRDLGWADFTSATGYTDTTTTRRADSTINYGSFTNLGLGLPDPGSSFFDVGLDMTKFTQEFRLASKTGSPLEWLVGVFYTKESGNQSQAVYLNQLDGSPLPAPYDAIAGTLAYLELPSDYKETAVFGNASYSFTDRFKLSAGIRYAQNDQNFSQNVSQGILLPWGESPNSSSENVFTWSLSPQFQLTQDTMLYAKVATGYQPGGPNVVGFGLPPSVDSSMLTSYEIGLKGLFMDNRLQVDAAVFHIDWTDIQVPTVVNNLSGLVNGGTASSDGVELAIVFQPTTNLQLGFNASYTDSTLSEDYPTIVIPAGTFVQEITQGLGGDRLPYVPKFSWSATADYYFPVGGDWEGNVGAALRVVDDQVTETSDRTVIRTASTPSVVLVDNTVAPTQLDGYQSLDLYAGVSNEHWSIRGYVKNVTDERAYTTLGSHTNALTGAVVHLDATPIRPRTFGIEFDYRF